MPLVPFDSYNKNPRLYEDYNHYSVADKHIADIIVYLNQRVEELINDANEKEVKLNSALSILDSQYETIEELASLVQEAVDAENLEVLNGLSKWLASRK